MKTAKRCVAATVLLFTIKMGLGCAPPSTQQCTITTTKARGGNVICLTNCDARQKTQCISVIDGKDGKDGEPGQAGAPGIPGQQGAQGPQGNSTTSGSPKQYQYHQLIEFKEEDGRLVARTPHGFLLTANGEPLYAAETTRVYVRPLMGDPANYYYQWDPQNLRMRFKATAKYESVNKDFVITRVSSTGAVLDFPTNGFWEKLQPWDFAEHGVIEVHADLPKNNTGNRYYAVIGVGDAATSPQGYPSVNSLDSVTTEYGLNDPSQKAPYQVCWHTLYATTMTKAGAVLLKAAIMMNGETETKGITFSVSLQVDGKETAAIVVGADKAGKAEVTLKDIYERLGAKLTENEWQSAALRVTADPNIANHDKFRTLKTTVTFR